MKKNFLSVLLALCMVLTLMPITALADFRDTDGHWGKDSIDRWAAEGVLNGKGDGVFDPNGSMTRAEFAQMLCNMMGYTKKAANTFTDVPNDAWYADAILKLAEAGVINGVGNNMAAPNAPITREQAAVMLARAFNIRTGSGSLSYADAGAVSSWAAGAVSALTEMGMLNGVGDNQVAPQLNINRASVAKLIDNMVAEYVTEDKTITGEVKGIIVVAGDAKVTLEDATVTAPVIVAPSAAGAEVALTGKTSAADVVVGAEKAAVTVAKDAEAGTVTVDAAGASAKVDGKVESLEVNAGSAATGKGSEVGTLTTTPDAESVKVDGKVDKAVADGTRIDTGASAEIKNVTISGDGAGVTGSGKVENATVAEGATNASVDTKGTNVENNSGETVGNVKPGETGTSTGSSSTGGSSGGSGTPAVPTINVTTAPQVDRNDSPTENLSTNYGVTTSGSTVTVTAKNIKSHKAGNNQTGYWIGAAFRPSTSGYVILYWNDSAWKIDTDSCTDGSIASLYINAFKDDQLNTTGGTIKVGVFNASDVTITDGTATLGESVSPVVENTYTVVAGEDCTADGKTMVKVKLVTASETTVSYPVDSSADKVTVSLPALENTDSKYFTGKWKVDSGEFEKKSESIELSKGDGWPESGFTLTAESVEIKAVNVDTRNPGPPTETNYGTIYQAAGMEFANNTISVNGNKLKKYITDSFEEGATNKSDLTTISITVGDNNYVMYGVQFPALAEDSGAVKAFYSYKGDVDVSVPAAGTDFSTWTDNPKEVNGQSWRSTTLATDDANSYQKCYVDYIQVARYTASAYGALSGDQARNYVVVYVDGSNNVVAIHTATVTRTITPVTGTPAD